MPRPEKVEAVSEIERMLADGQSVVLVEMSGMTVAQSSELRSRLLREDVTLKVHKNTLINIAAQNLEIAGIEAYLRGPTALAVSHREPSSAVRVMLEFIRQLDEEQRHKLRIKAALLGTNLLDEEQAKQLTELPTFDEARALLAGRLVAPLAGLVTTLNAPQTNLARCMHQVVGGLASVLHQRAEQRRGEEAA